MATYVIKYRHRGSVKETKLTAGSADIARQRGKRYGAVLTVRREANAGGRRGMSSSERYTFLVRLSTMLASKMSTAEALRLIRNSFTGSISDTAAGLLEKIDLGIDLPSAIAEDGRNFPGSMGLIIKVGAKSGHIHQALQDAADFEHKLINVKAGSGRVIISAICGFIFAGLTVASSVFYIGPKVMKMGIVANYQSSVDVAWVDGIAKFVAIILLVSALGMLFLLVLATVVRKFSPAWAEKIILKIPIYSDIVMSRDNYLVLRRLALLIGSGVRIEEALDSAVQTAKPGVVREDLKRSLQYMKIGQKWANGMSFLHPTDRAALLLSSDRKQIAINLDMIAQQALTLYFSRINAFAPTLQVISAFALTLAGLVLFGQTMLPMLQVAAKLTL